MQAHDHHAITLYTLFDITYTGILHNGNYNVSKFFDKAGQIVENINQWERSRNQQRNWQIIVQLLGLRAIPNILSMPVKKTDDLNKYKFGSIFTGIQNVWTVSFAMEHTSVLTVQTEFDLLIQDFDSVPLTTGLTETAIIKPKCLITSGINQNIYFEKS